jgi:hypothetical protein
MARRRRPIIPPGGMIATQNRGQNPQIITRDGQVIPITAQQAAAAGAPVPAQTPASSATPSAAAPAAKPRVGKLRQFGRNYLLRPLAGLLGIDIKPYVKGEIATDEEIVKLQESLPPQVREMLDKLIDKTSERLDYLVGPSEDVSLEELEKLVPQAIPSMEEIQASMPALPDTSFEPIDQLARQKFEQETIPGLAERFAGLGGLNSTAFQGELGKAGTNLESQLAALRSQHGLQQGQLGLQQQDVASRRAGILGQLGLGQQSQDLARAQTLGNLRMGQQGQRLQERGLLANLIGIQTQRPTIGTPNTQQNPWINVGDRISQLATTLAPLLWL